MQWQQQEDCAQEESLDCQIDAKEEEEECSFGVWGSRCGYGHRQKTRGCQQARATTQGIHHCH
jgi:hypothetical protein